MENVLQVEKRSATGTRACDRLRAEGKLPGVVYGKDVGNVNITLPKKDFLHMMDQGVRKYALDIEGDTKDVLVKDLTYGTYDHIILHADFEVFDPNKPVQVRVDVHVVGKAKGLKWGAQLKQFVHQVAVECLPKDIPTKIDLDVENLNVTQMVHMKDLVLPEGVTVVNDPDVMVVSCQMPRGHSVPAAALEELEA